MKEKGFTLIELLAVIVILAIIALIATPIILNIINDTKKSATERSKEMYLDAVEQAIARKNLTSSFNPSTCTVKSDGNLNCDAGELVVEIKGQKPNEGGTITIKDGKITENTLKFDGNAPEEQPTNTIGKAVTSSNKTKAGNIPQGNFALGDEYIVNVDGTHEYHFYILGTEGEKVTLIMSNNICSDGTLATESNKCLVNWNDNESSAMGPVAAMNYLHDVTKTWNNINNIEINYVDEDGNYLGYGGLTTTGNDTTITKKDGTVVATYTNLKARLLKKSEMVSAGCLNSKGSCPVWMVNGLNSSSNYSTGTKEDIAGIYGYWGLSSSTNSGSYFAWYVSSSGNSTDINFEGIGEVEGSGNGVYLPEPGGYLDRDCGVRPVIQVLKSDLS